MEQLYSLSSERAAIGSLLLYPKTFIQTIDRLTTEHFYDEKHKLIFGAMSSLYISQQSYDSISVGEKIKELDPDFRISDLVEIQSGDYFSFNLDKYLNILEDKYKRRSMYLIGDDIHSRTTDLGQEVESIVHDSLENITNVLSTAEDSSFANTIEEIEAKIEEFEESDSDILGMSTGLEKLDKMLDGIQGGQFIGFAAYTSQGKTWDALNIAYNLIEQGKKVCFISLENSKAQILTRLASIHTRISDNKIKKGQLSPDQMLNVRDYMKKVVASGSTVYRNSNWDSIKTAITKEALVNKPDIFILDYLQNIRGDKDSVRLLEDVSSYLQNTLISIDIPMLALSQISNATANGDVKDEVLKFKGSGAIGQSVSTAIFKKSVHTREEIEQRRQNGVPLESWWIIEKNRDGDYTGRIKTYFHPWTHKLYGEEEFERDYGLIKYQSQLDNLPELSTGKDDLSKALADF